MMVSNLTPNPNPNYKGKADMLPSYHPLQVSTFAVNYKGKPYMEGLSANKGLLVTLGKIDVVRW